MYAEIDLLSPSSQIFSQEINNVENIWQLNKEILSGDLGENLTVTELDLEGSDLFKAPITNDESAHEHQDMAISIESQQNITEEEIDLLQITRLNELLLYACDGAQDLGSSIIESNPPTSPLMATQTNSPENSLINSSNAMLTNTVQDVVLDLETVSISGTSESPPLAKIMENSIAPSALASKENDVIGDSSGPVPTYLQKPLQMQRSLSSHELGQMNAVPPVNYTSLCPQFYPVCYSLGQRKPNPDSKVQMPHSDIQRLNMRPPFRSMRRVYSTGDIKWTKNTMQMDHRSGRPLESKCLSFEEAGLKIGHYTMEERRQRIHRYRKKRTRRNFNRKIKYACRKSLADSQPRVRGRFAPKNEDIEGSTAKPSGYPKGDQEEVVDMIQKDDDRFLMGCNSTYPLNGIIEMVLMKADHASLFVS